MLVSWFKDIGIKDVPKVGGKNASLGEMYRKLNSKGVRVPNGFATTSSAYWEFLKQSGIKNKIKTILDNLDIKDIKGLEKRGKEIRQLILSSNLPEKFENEIILFYKKLSEQYNTKAVDVAVRSSATAEDMPSASFAGQMDTHLNIKGEKQLLGAVKKCIASLFTNRAIVYRQEKGFDHLKVAISIGVQKMIRSDISCSGVMFSCDTESGFADVTVINSSWGLGENIVQGKVSPDEFMVYEPNLDKFKPIISKKIGSKEWKMIYNTKKGKQVKNIRTTLKEKQSFTLTDDEILELARYSVIIEKYYNRPMDMEWAKDGKDKKLYILQARPETVQSQKSIDVLTEYVFLNKKNRQAFPSKRKYKDMESQFTPIVSGTAIGSKIGAGQANVIKNVKDISKFKSGQILITQMTDPDWVPIMKQAKAIVTNSGGRTCFARDTQILTNKGFFSIKKIVENYKKENYKVLSLNKKTLKMEWKMIVDGMKRRSAPVSVNISQSGRMKNNILKVTSDHKFLTFKNRRLISKELKKIINDNEFILSPDYIPHKRTKQKLSPELGYLIGGISTDGSIYLSKTHGEVQFIQKPTPEKANFIKKMTDCMKNVFDYSFHVSQKKPTNGIIRGKPINGSANAYRCYSKDIAQKLLQEQKKLVKSLLIGQKEFVYNFLAGVIDGDGSYFEKSNRINIFCSKEYLLQAIITACLRLNISFQTSVNRNISNVQLVNGIEEIFKYTARVNGKYERHRFGTKYFSAKQLLKDIQAMVNYKGRVKSYINKNLLIDSEKIKKYIIPLIAGQESNHELTKIINSDIKMLRIGSNKLLKHQDVYNITVEKNHNYVVFTNRYTPVVVNNCHASIISRELGIPCIVGTKNATKKIKQNQAITVSCAEGETGYVYKGIKEFKVKKTKIKNFKKPKTKIMMNLAEPEQAFALSFIPNDGVGLAREEFIINNYIKIHPLALIHYSKIKIKTIKQQIDKITAGYSNKSQFYVDKLAEGIGKIASAFYPKQVIVRFSDFKTNEYANLIGGKEFEPIEANPMIGWRGASRYYSPEFKKAFDLECLAIKKVRQEMGLDNVIVMVPFCRTIEEGKKVLDIIDKHGLRKKQTKLKPLQVYVMAEIPSNVILGDEFAKIFDGFSIGTNDLTQLTLGLDRDSGLVSHLFDERNEAVKRIVKQMIKTAHKYNRKIGICGQAPSDFPEFAEFLVEQGIDSISLNPDTIMKTSLDILKKEKKLKK